MILQSFRMAFSSIAGRKMRSFLTMLGIIIGTIAVVVLVSLVSGATSSVTSSIESLGSNLLTVNITSSRYLPLSLQDVENIAAENENISATAAKISQSGTVKAGSTTYSASIIGTVPAYQDLSALTLARGRFLKTPDLDNNSAVAILGYEAADELFGRQDVVGETVSIGGRSFLVVGVLEESGQTVMGSNDSAVIIPYTLAQRLYHVSGVSSFYAAAADAGNVDAAEAALDQVLLAHFRQDEDAYTVFNQTSILETMSSVTDTLSLLLGGIAGISLLVGGIGIMNIMLVSVIERTREIGIRKAVGASRGSILMQFLIEALVLSLLGGLIGLGISYLIVWGLSAVLQASYTVPAYIVMISLGFSIFVGVIFGLYPANKASKLHPIEALRAE